MFQSLMNGYLGSLKEDFLKADDEAFRRRIMFLELLTLNFDEFLNTKPLFEDVYWALERKQAFPQTEEERQNWERLEQQIIRVSMRIVARQARVLNSIGTSAVFNIEKDEAICVKLYDRADFAYLRTLDGKPFDSFTPGPCVSRTLTERSKSAVAAEPQGAGRRLSLEVMPVAVKKAYATVQVRVYEDIFEKNVLQGSVLTGSLRFDASYFDLPYMDNTKLSDGSRFALVLRGIESNSIEIEVIRFRNDFMSLRDRPYFAEMVKQLEDSGGSNSARGN
jgi:hypothetical protein